MLSCLGADAPVLGTEAAAQTTFRESGSAHRETTRVHLVETPFLPSPEILRRFEALKFNCFACGERIIDGTSHRITQRPTPVNGPDGDRDGGHAPRGLYVTATAVHATSAINWQFRTSVRQQHRPESLRHPETPVFYRDVGCAACGAYLGYRLETEEGQPYDMSTRGGRQTPFKLWYQCGEERKLYERSAGETRGVKGVGAVLALADEAAYAQLVAALPPGGSSRTATKVPPRGVERTERVVEALQGSEPKKFDAVAEELALGWEQAALGRYLLRNVAQSDGDLRTTNLRARNPTACISAAAHVSGERDSQYISVSGDFSTSLPSGLPLGDIVCIIPRFAAALGNAFFNAKDPAVQAAADRRVKDMLERYARMSDEHFFVGEVDNACMELVDSRICHVRSGPTVVGPAVLSTETMVVADSGGTTAARDDGVPFPRTPADWESLLPGTTVPDRVGGSQEEAEALRTVFGGKTPSAYLSRRTVVPLAFEGARAPAFLLVRMKPNSLDPSRLPPLPDKGLEDTVKLQKERLAAVLHAGSKQLQEAAASCLTLPRVQSVALRYYELDVEVFQMQRVVFPALHNYNIQGVPVLLLRWKAGVLELAHALCERLEEGSPKHAAQR